MLLRGVIFVASLLSLKVSEAISSNMVSPSSLYFDMPMAMLHVSDKSTIAYSPEGDLMSIPAMMNYVTPDTDVGHIRRNPDGSDIKRCEGAALLPTEVRIKNGRFLPTTLSEHGFELVRDDYLENTEEAIDFLDTRDVVQRYYGLCENLLKKKLGNGVDVKAFDHNIRLAEDGFPDKKELKNGGGSTTQNPLGLVHGDYTAVSAPQRIQDLAQPPKVNDVLRFKLGETPLLCADTVQQAVEGKRRFALINVWRSIDPEQPVQMNPLACAIDKSVSRVEDLRRLQIHYADRIGENFLVTASPRHEWRYFPQMTIDEALLIKQWDSEAFTTGKGAAFSIHSSFKDPTTTDSAPPRQSIEVRCVVIWDEEEIQ